MKIRKIKKLLMLILLISIIVIPNLYIENCFAEVSTIAAPASVKSETSSDNSIKITWGAVSGASGYSVYRAASSTGVYTAVVSITGTSYSDSGLLSGKTYYYKVKAYKTVGKTKVYSKYSAVVYSTAKVSVKSISLNKTTCNLTVGDTNTLTAAILPTNATNKAVKWSSSKKSVATVDSKGKVTAVNAGTATITVTTADGNKTAKCIVTVNNKKGYVYNTNVDIDLKVRSAPGLSGSIVGYLYNYQKIEILDTITDSNGIVWDKIIYKGKTAYVSNAYIQLYTSPPDNVVNIARNITKQFEVGNSNQIAGNFDGQGLSLGYFQWCIGQGTLQPLLNRMDRQYNKEMRSIFGTNYDKVHEMTLSTLSNQLKWAQSINNSSNKIKEPWYSQLIKLSNNQHFISIERDSEIYLINRAMIICDKYKLKTIRGFALALDIVVQNGSISSEAAKVIDAAIAKTPNITEKKLLGVIANAVSGNSADIRSRKLAIVNGQGTVHGSMLYLDSSYGLSDKCWR